MVKKEFRLELEFLEYLEELRQQHHLSSLNDALRLAVSQHKQFIGVDSKALFRTLIQAVNSQYGDLIKTIHFAVQNVDKNTQILIELMNTLLIHENIQKAIVTELLESLPLQEVKETVKQRISVERQKKITYSKKNGVHMDTVLKLGE